MDNATEETACASGKRTSARTDPCQICAKTFSRAYDLERHMAVHSKKTHTCQVCQSTFTRKDGLKVHMLKHTEPTECVARRKLTYTPDQGSTSANELTDAANRESVPTLNKEHGETSGMKDLEQELQVHTETIKYLLSEKQRLEGVVDDQKDMADAKQAAINDLEEQLDLERRRHAEELKAKDRKTEEEQQKQLEAKSMVGMRKSAHKYQFSFDHIFAPSSSQAEVFEQMSQLVQSALDGHNVSIFAYGPTGTGKTYSLHGSDDSSAEHCGIITRSFEQIFQTAERLQHIGWEAYARFLTRRLRPWTWRRIVSSSQRFENSFPAVRF